MLILQIYALIITSMCWLQNVSLKKQLNNDNNKNMIVLYAVNGWSTFQFWCCGLNRDLTVASFACNFLLRSRFWKFRTWIRTWVCWPNPKNEVSFWFFFFNNNKWRESSKKRSVLLFNGLVLFLKFKGFPISLLVFQELFILVDTSDSVNVAVYARKELVDPHKAN